jgi:2-polyprenyl-3-methyl-5-hydroxy-6-metoxy-1,4-benzoquinol methylase
MSISTYVGVQEQGSSSEPCKNMAYRALDDALRIRPCAKLADIGGGKGDFSKTVQNKFESIFLLDYDLEDNDPKDAKIFRKQCDLNKSWCLDDQSVDVCFAIEVIEHLENPRHLLREAKRITKRGGLIYLSTPNNHSLASKLTFLTRGMHRGFQELNYPAHITPILICDLHRMADEMSLIILGFYSSDFDRLPKLWWKISIGGKAFSHSIGVLFQKTD